MMGSGRRGDLVRFIGVPPRRTSVFGGCRLFCLIEASRTQNERTFTNWEELPGGGRRYFREFAGRAGGRARYIKEVDAAENTVRFAQEIYHPTGRLIALHEKFPVDLGHKQL